MVVILAGFHKYLYNKAFSIEIFTKNQQGFMHCKWIVSSFFSEQSTLNSCMFPLCTIEKLVTSSHLRSQDT